MVVWTQLLTPGMTTYERWSLGISALVPLVLAVVGYYISRAARRLDHAQWTNQKVIERRIELLKDIAPLANKIYCYFMWIGRWKEYTPPQVTEFRRDLADCLYTNAYMFSNDLMQRYREFEATCFLLYEEANHDAKLRTTITRGTGKDIDDRKTFFGDQWKEEEWKVMFEEPESDLSNEGTIARSYDGLVRAFRRDLRQVSDTASHSTPS